MRAAIGHTLAYPERLPKVIPKLGLDQMSKLEFLPPDETRFPCLRLARQALENGPGSLIALNAANEVAVGAFLEKRISFPKIPHIVEEVLGQNWPAKVENLGQTVELDVAARRAASSFFG
jgi:1-deoxy-D-xylulose-5-phosphate reductoisomerase